MYILMDPYGNAWKVGIRQENFIDLINEKCKCLPLVRGRESKTKGQVKSTIWGCWVHTHTHIYIYIYAPFSGASHRIDLHLAQRIESVPERALCSQVGSVWRESFSSSSTSFFFFFSVRTAFKRYRLPTSRKKHTGTGSSSPNCWCS